MLNGKNIAWNIYKKEYSNGKTIKLLSNFHSIISGACFTFFIGLFSAGPDSISNSYFLWMATLGFAISTLLNICFSLFYTFMNNERELIFEIHTYSRTGVILLNLSLLLPVLSFIFLIFYYSLYIGFIVLTCIIAVKYLKKMISNEIKETKSKQEKIRKMLINEKKYHELGIFCKHNDFPILTQEEEKNRIIEFYFYIKTKVTINNWMKTINQDGININTEALTKSLLVILSEICKSEGSNNELLEEIKKILLLCATDGSIVTKQELLNELQNLNERIENKIDYLK